MPRKEITVKKILGLLLTLVLLIAACAAWAEQPAGSEAAQEMENMMKIRINDKTYLAELEDSDAARAFAALLPMQLHMTELNGNEKYHYLMSGLPNAPERVGHIEAGDLMLFGDDCVVVFYESFSTPYSYTRIGRILDIGGLAEQLGSRDTDVSFEPAE